MNVLGKQSDLPLIARRRKARVPLRMSRMLFAAKHCWMALRMSRPLFVGSYLVGSWPMKRKKNCFV